jgi:acetyl-CoA carboxylase biotin carboxyl carrier protein
VRRIVAAARASDVAELEVARGEFRVRVQREVESSGILVAAPSATPAALVEYADLAHLHRVAAPLTGVFYRSASPDAKAYVNIGDWVGGDDVIGLIETMKIFNEVTADQAGRVVALLAQNGQLVHAGEPLVALEPAARTVAEPEAPRP